MALSQDLEAGPHGTTPPRFPVFSKPIVNLKGMGTGSRVLQSQADYDAALRARPFLDAAARRPPSVNRYRRGRWRAALVAARHRRGRAGGGTFDYWTVQAASEPVIEAHCGAWVRAHLAGYTGMLNLETIGGRIIEAHLRFADQWPDLYGAGWVEAVVRLYEHGIWNFADEDRRDGYSVVLFGPNGVRYRHPPPALLEEVKQMAGHLQRADHVPRRSCAGASCDAAGRFPARHCQWFRSRRPGSPRANGCKEHFLTRPD